MRDVQTMAPAFTMGLCGLSARNTNQHGTSSSDCACDFNTQPIHVFGASLTVLVEEELVEAQAAGLLADEAVHVLGAVVVHGHGVLEGLDARLQAEGHLGVAHRVSGGTDGQPERQTCCLGR